MIIYDILNQEKNNLKFLGKSDKNIDIISNMITELKKHNITIDILNNLNIESNYTNLKVNDIKLIYEKYLEKIENSFIDENDILTIILDKIEEATLFEDSLIYIDDFIGFTPQEYKVFEKLLLKAKNVTITVPIDNLELGNKEQDVFYFNKVFVNNIIKIAKNNKVKLELFNCDKNFRLKNDELKFWAPKEFDIFINLVDDQQYYTLFNFLYHTGCRKGEALAMTWKDIDFKNDVVRIYKSVTTKIKGSPYAITSPKTKNSIRNIPMFFIIIEKNQARSYYFIYAFQNDNPSVPLIIV